MNKNLKSVYLCLKAAIAGMFLLIIMLVQKGIVVTSCSSNVNKIERKTKNIKQHET